MHDSDRFACSSSPTLVLLSSLAATHDAACSRKYISTGWRDFLRSASRAEVNERGDPRWGETPDDAVNFILASHQKKKAFILFITVTDDSCVRQYRTSQFAFNIISKLLLLKHASKSWSPRLQTSSLNFVTLSKAVFW